MPAGLPELNWATKLKGVWALLHGHKGNFAVQWLAKQPGPIRPSGDHSDIQSLVMRLLHFYYGSGVWWKLVPCISPQADLSVWRDRFG